MIGVASLITILDLLILKILISLSQVRKSLAPRIDRWVQDGVFQLQRRAYESNNQGTWMLLESEIPVTSVPELLNDLPLETYCPNYSRCEPRPSCKVPDTLELHALSTQSTQKAPVELAAESSESREHSHSGSEGDFASPTATPEGCQTPLYHGNSSEDDHIPLPS